MRFLILSLVLANAALMAATDSASAQSPTSYPWSRTRSGVAFYAHLVHEK
jgi:hypothetical protein